MGISALAPLVNAAEMPWMGFRPSRGRGKLEA
jgi:hypothetical protein